jgi:hypothetical protein
LTVALAASRDFSDSTSLIALSVQSRGRRRNALSPAAIQITRECRNGGDICHRAADSRTGYAAVRPISEKPKGVSLPRIEHFLGSPGRNRCFLLPGI